ncbi:unnamed protein product [Adineta ricciae]|uniref:Uncharacterized protein n=1 Tax=Adineta ricciae TaxID=249248 RepID=A0A814U515_ADIRI|nr:unnamed protein product [Adineta ricciae]
MYNSSTTSNQDDGEVTMISHSLFYNLPKAGRNFNSDSYVSDRNNNIFDDDDANDVSEAVQQIEQVLEYYRKELKQESYTQLDCNRKLITRLFDFIRPTYSMHKKKMNDLNALFEEISALQDLRFIRVKDKQEHLTNEISQLKKLMISANEGHSYKSTVAKASRLNPVINYEQWMAMEEEARKLSNLVELQRDRINELINLISQEDTSSLQLSSSSSTSRNFIAHCEELPTRKRQSATSSANSERLLVATIPSPVDEQHDSGTETLQRSTNEFRSLDTVNTGERSTVITSTLPPLSRISSYNDIKKCPICNDEFSSTANEFEIIRHVESCLSTAGIEDPGAVPQPKQYVCPYCSRQFQGNDEKAYHQHLAFCYTDYPENF